MLMLGNVAMPYESLLSDFYVVFITYCVAFV